ncbi:MAG: DUF2630 family protein [Actinomycetota bacterium]|nr:DUF2630 family protein [Actinomycetota bacterium]
MDDNQIHEVIDRALAEEHELRTHHRRGPLEATEARRLRELQDSLDQCWDLLRQRRARREFGLDPDDVGVRDPEILQHYRQ